MKNKPFEMQWREARERHRSELARQIFLPLVLLSLLTIALLFWIVLREGERVNAVAALATIWLILPLLCLGGGWLALLIGLIYLLAQALSAFPAMAQQVQLFNWRLQRRARHLADRAVAPFFRLHEGGAMIEKALRLIHPAKYGGVDGRDAFLED
uniref:Uncharacterized protein n=1 Tax=uncultured Chloroflexota bacterium TaxID=166587 RepID=H5SFN9_9CHLR|nr:hypothetical protein HGMM_F22C05C21 [uncultured Chloroflexota bacterium]